jgi:hypothetical protein
MARTVTLLQLRTRARQLANMESATNLWPDADVTERVNTHLTELYDTFRVASPPDYYSTSVAIAVVAGTTAYAFASDFIDVQSVYVRSSSAGTINPGDVKYEVRPIRESERGFLQTPTQAYNVVVEYTPTLTLLASDGATFDGVNGWDELVVALVARDMLTKARESTEALEIKINEMRMRIRTMGTRDRGAPQYIRDVDESSYRGTVPGAASLYGYRIRAGNIEFYECATVWP